MITSPEEFKQKLLEIQNEKITFTTLPSSEPRFIINADTREVLIPSEFSFLSVKNDHKAETIYFEIDRYYDNTDLSQHTCVIQFANTGTSGQYNEGINNASELDITTLDGKIVFGWTIGNDATQYSGSLTFSIRFYSISDDRLFSYNFNTTSKTLPILDTLSVIDRDYVIEPSLLSFWEDRMNTLNQNIAADINRFNVEMSALSETIKGYRDSTKTTYDNVIAKSAEINTTITTGVTSLQNKSNEQVAIIGQKGIDTLATIPEDYTQIDADVEHLKKESVRYPSRFANALIATAEGEGQVLVTDAWDAPVVDMEIDGASEQVTTTGAQLLDIELPSTTTKSGVTISLTEDGGIHLNGTATDSGNHRLIDPVQNLSINCDSATLSLQASGAYDGTVMVSDAADGEWKNLLSVKNNATATGTAKTSKLGCYVTYVAGTTYNVTLYPMLCASPAALPWEPYTGGKPSPSPEYPQAIKGVGTKEGNPDASIVIKNIGCPSTTGKVYGVEVNFTNNQFTRIADAANLSAGSGFDNVSCFGGRKRVNLTDSGVELAAYGEAGYTETGKLTQAITKDGVTYPAGTTVQVMVRQPKFYYKVEPILLDPIKYPQMEEIVVTGAATTDGTITVTIGAVSKTVSITAGMSTAAIASAIAKLSFTNFQTRSAGTTVRFVSRISGVRDKMTVSFGGTGVTGNIKSIAEAPANGHHLRKARYYISDEPKTGFKLHPAFIVNCQEKGVIYRAAYESCIYDTSASIYLMADEQVCDFATTTGDKLSSIAGAKPCSGNTQNLTRNNARIMAANRGAGWSQSYTISASATEMLMLVEFASFDVQKAIGAGNVNRSWLEDGVNWSENTGATAALGNASGAVTITVPGQTAGTTQNIVMVTYRGEENPWGNIWKFEDGINVMPQWKHDFYISDHSFADAKADGTYVKVGFPMAFTEGYISAFGYDKDFDFLFIASETNSNSSLSIGNYTYSNVASSDWYVVLAGGSWDHGLLAGVLFRSSNATTGLRRRYISGGRLVYVPSENDSLSQLVTISLSEPLHGIGDVQDRIAYKDGVWGVERQLKKFVFNGSENWELNVKSNNKVRYRLLDATIAPFDINVKACAMCDVYITRTAAETHAEKQGIAVGVVQDVLIYDESTSDENTVDRFKSQLQTNPINAIFQSKSPVWEPFPAETQTALNALITHPGTTYLTVASTDVAATVKLEYVQDTRKVIDGLQASIQVLTDKINATQTV